MPPSPAPPSPPSAPPFDDMWEASCRKRYGPCNCFAGYMGADCGTYIKCEYWDEELEGWNTEGCVASAPPSGRPDGFLHCNCTHLTDFGGISIPTSPAELLAELTSV